MGWSTRKVTPAHSRATAVERTSSALNPRRVCRKWVANSRWSAPGPAPGVTGAKRVPALGTHALPKGLGRGTSTSKASPLARTSKLPPKRFKSSLVRGKSSRQTSAGSTPAAR